MVINSKKLIPALSCCWSTPSHTLPKTSAHSLALTDLFSTLLTPVSIQQPTLSTHSFPLTHSTLLIYHPLAHWLIHRCTRYVLKLPMSGKTMSSCKESTRIVKDLQRVRARSSLRVSMEVKGEQSWGVCVGKARADLVVRDDTCNSFFFQFSAAHPHALQCARVLHRMTFENLPERLSNRYYKLHRQGGCATVCWCIYFDVLGSVDIWVHIILCDICIAIMFIFGYNRVTLKWILRGNETLIVFSFGQ